MQFKILVIFAQISLIGRITSSIIQYGLPSERVFWIAAVIAVAIGFLSYNVYKRFLTRESYKGWGFLNLVLMVIGIGVPIGLYFTVESLESAGGTWIVYLLTFNSFIFYRIVRKEPISRRDILSGRI